MAPENGWNEWSKHVLLELKRLNTCYKELDGKLEEKVTKLNEKIEEKVNDVIKKIDKMNNRLTMVQIKMASLCATVSVVVTIVVLIVASFMKK